MSADRHSRLAATLDRDYWPRTRADVAEADAWRRAHAARQRVTGLCHLAKGLPCPKGGLCRATKSEACATMPIGFAFAPHACQRCRTRHHNTCPGFRCLLRPEAPRPTGAAK